ERVVHRLLHARQQGLARTVEAQQMSILGEELGDRDLALARAHLLGGDAARRTRTGLARRRFGRGRFTPHRLRAPTTLVHGLRHERVVHDATRFVQAMESSGSAHVEGDNPIARDKAAMLTSQASGHATEQPKECAMRMSRVHYLALAALLVATVAYAAKPQTATATLGSLAASGVTGSADLKLEQSGTARIHEQLSGLEPGVQYTSEVFIGNATCGSGAVAVEIMQFTANAAGKANFN